MALAAVVAANAPGFNIYGYLLRGRLVYPWPNDGQDAIAIGYLNCAAVPHTLTVNGADYNGLTAAALPKGGVRLCVVAPPGLKPAEVFDGVITNHPLFTFSVFHRKWDGGTYKHVQTYVM